MQKSKTKRSLRNEDVFDIFPPSSDIAYRAKSIVITKTLLAFYFIFGT